MRQILLDSDRRGAHLPLHVTDGIVDVFDQQVWNATRAEGELPSPVATFCRVAGSSACRRTPRLDAWKS